MNIQIKDWILGLTVDLKGFLFLAGLVLVSWLLFVFLPEKYKSWGLFGPTGLLLVILSVWAAFYGEPFPLATLISFGLWYLICGIIPDRFLLWPVSLGLFLGLFMLAREILEGIFK